MYDSSSILNFTALVIVLLVNMTFDGCHDAPHLPAVAGFQGGQVCQHYFQLHMSRSESNTRECPFLHTIDKNACCDTYRSAFSRVHTESVHI